MNITHVARAAGQDLANARMRKAGRTSWNKADYAAAVREFNRVMDAFNAR